MVPAVVALLEGRPTLRMPVRYLAANNNARGFSIDVFFYPYVFCS